MFKIVAFLALLSTAIAFVPTGRMKTSTSVSMDFKSEIGAQPPLGFWDVS
jgi:hypothetical protein